MVKFKIRGPISKRLGATIVELDLGEGITLSEALEQLIEKNSAVKKEWNSLETMGRESLIMVNQQDIEVLQGFDIVLNAEDIVTILPLIHGG